MNLTVDPKRLGAHVPQTAIYVRAQHSGKWTSTDISSLDRDSLLAWMQEREQNNPNFLYMLVLTMLDHTIPAEIIRAEQEADRARNPDPPDNDEDDA
jgi:hypothetical protein